MNDEGEVATWQELLVARTIDRHMADDTATLSSPEGNAHVEAETPAWMAHLLQGLSVDGLMRMIYGLSTAAMYVPEAQIGRARGGLAKARQNIASAMSLAGKISGDVPVVLNCHRPSALVDLLGDLSASPTATASDQSAASSLLRILLGQPSRSTIRSVHASLSQGVLF